MASLFLMEQIFPSIYGLNSFSIGLWISCHLRTFPSTFYKILKNSLDSMFSSEYFSSFYCPLYHRTYFGNLHLTSLSPLLHSSLKFFLCNQPIEIAFVEIKNNSCVAQVQWHFSDFLLFDISAALFLPYFAFSDFISSTSPAILHNYLVSFASFFP